MATRERALDRGRRDASRHLAELGSELREARLGAGLSQAILGRSIGLSHAAVSRIERSAAANVPLRQLDEMAAVLGLRLSVRLYPVGRPLRDAGQLALLDRLRSQLAPGLIWRTEVPIPIEGDLRAWDASISGHDWTAFVDAETRLRDIQAIERRTALKQRDSDADRVILLIADTRSNRAVLASLGRPLLGGPRSGSAILEGLRAGRDPDGAGVILL